MSVPTTPARGLRAATLVAASALGLPAAAPAQPHRPATPTLGGLPGQEALLALTPGPAPSLAGGLVDELRTAGKLQVHQLERHRAAVARAAARRHDAVLVRRMVKAGNRIATLPYVWGGGHGSFQASGYDCSGSVSYVLHGAGLLDRPLASGDLMSYGEPGPGRHVTIYANGGHAYMTIDGRRFDTSAHGPGGSRWTHASRSSAGYTVRHPAGL
jgi:cell wall-associated NlpC family hydrolase